MQSTLESVATSMPALVLQRAATNASETIMRRKDRGIWKAVSWAQLADQMKAIGGAVLAMDVGRGDAAAIISETRLEAVYADLAIQGAGAASIVIHPDDAADHVRHILHSTGCRLVFVESEEQLDKILTVGDHCPALSRIVIFDMKGLREFTDHRCVSMEAFITGYSSTADWPAAVKAVVLDQPAIVLFPRDDTSLMSRPLTHREVLRMIEGGARLSLRAGDERLAVLRMADITERIWGLYLALTTGCISNYLESPETAVENLQELQPTVLGADAEAWAHLHTRATGLAKAATQVQRWAYAWALRLSRSGSAGAGLAGVLVLHAVRRELGLNKVRVAYVAGAPVGLAALEWARCLGIAIERVDEPASGGGQLDAASQGLMQDAHA